jgi:hypothetical protein
MEALMGKSSINGIFRGNHLGNKFYIWEKNTKGIYIYKG